MQFSQRKEDVAPSTYFQLKHDDRVGEGNSRVVFPVTWKEYSLFCKIK